MELSTNDLFTIIGRQQVEIEMLRAQLKRVAPPPTPKSAEAAAETPAEEVKEA